MTDIQLKFGGPPGGKGADGLMAPGSHDDMVAGDRNDVAGTPANLKGIGLDANVAPRLKSVRDSLMVSTPAAAVISDNTQVNPAGEVIAPANGYRVASLPLDDSIGGINVDQARTIGTGNSLATWYSDDAGTELLSVSTQKGDAPYHQYSDVYLAKPDGAKYVRINGATSEAIIVETLAVGEEVGQRVADLEGLGLDAISAALYQFVDQQAPITDGMHVDPNGGISAGNGYQYAKDTLTLDDKATASGTVIGSTRNLVEYYSDVACTQANHISGQYPGSGGTGTPYEDEPLTIPAGTQGVLINGTASGIPPRIKKRQVSVGGQDNPYAGVEWAVLLDSNGGNNRWQPTVSRILGLGTYTNCGLGGSCVSKPDLAGKVSMCDDARIDAIPLTARLILFGGLTNDLGQSRLFGAITPLGTTVFDNTTVYGALETVATKLLARFVGLDPMIVWLTTLFEQNTQRVTDGVWTSPYYDLNGKSTLDCAQAIKDVANKYGFPVSDWRGELGFNPQNAADYYDDEGGETYVHINATKGGPLAGAFVADKLLAMKQVAALKLAA